MAVWTPEWEEVEPGVFRDVGWERYMREREHERSMAQQELWRQRYEEERREKEEREWQRRKARREELRQLVHAARRAGVLPRSLQARQEWLRDPVGTYYAARKEHAWRLRQEKVTYLAISKRLGISPGRVRELVFGYLRRHDFQRWKFLTRRGSKTDEPIVC